MRQNLKMQFVYWIFFIIFYQGFIVPLYCFCFEQTQSITITKEDLINAKPAFSDVSFSKKDLKMIEMMEKRHFQKIFPEFSDFERLKNLEYELFGRVWLYSPQKDRINYLKLASSNRMLLGTALPPSLSSPRTVKRLRNDVIQLRQTDNDVGLIDGFLRLLSPEKYEIYRQRSKRMFEIYEY